MYLFRVLGERPLPLADKMPDPSYLRMGAGVLSNPGIRGLKV